MLQRIGHDINNTLAIVCTNRGLGQSDKYAIAKSKYNCLWYGVNNNKANAAFTDYTRYICN